MTQLPSGTVTFLFTDIEGSTRLLRELGPAYDGLLADHQRILRETFAAHAGREVDTQGDSFFVAFARAGDAVACAVDARRALADHLWPAGVEVRVRMGLHSGEPRASGKRYVGFGVHRAARIGAVGHGGQILVSNATRELIEDELPAGTLLRDLGEFELKDVERPERLFQVDSDGVTSAFLPLKAPRIAAPRPLGKRWGVLAAAGALVIAVAGAGVVLLSRGAAGPTVVPNSLVRIAEESNDIVDVVPVGQDPGQVEIVADYVFVASQEDGTLFRIDLETGDLRTSGELGATGSIDGEGDSLWVVSVSNDAVFRVNAESLGTTAKLPISPLPSLQQAWVESGGDSLWLSQWFPTAVTRWRQPTLVPEGRYPLDPDEYPAQVAFGAGAAWVALTESDQLLRVDARSEQAATVPVGQHPRDPAFGFGSLWVAMAKDGAVWRLDPATQTASAIVEAGRRPWGVGIGEDAVWVSNHCDGTVSKIDPSNNEVVATIDVGFYPQWLAVGGGTVWVGLAETEGAQGISFEDCN